MTHRVGWEFSPRFSGRTATPARAGEQIQLRGG